MNRDTKKLLIFWSLAIPFLLGWFFFWQIKNNQWHFWNKLIYVVPMEEQKKNALKTAGDIVEYFSQKDNQTRTFLLLFQNDLELRPGGGYMGSFGILKIKNGAVVALETHDTNIFDGRIKDTVAPPYPMEEMLHIKSWGLRDSNWFPDFREDAEKAEYFYKAGDGQENFDGVIALNTHVLESVLEVTGPVNLPGSTTEFNSQNVVLQLEYEVEKGYEQKGLDIPNRKSLIGDLAGALKERVSKLSLKEKLSLLSAIEKNLNQKDIQLYFKDTDLESKMEALGWAGRINSDWKDDYLMINDANLGGYKADLKIQRKMDYTVDLTKEKPEAVLKIDYINSAEKKDWLIKDYQGYLRVYVPSGSWLNENTGTGERNFMDEYNKKVFGFIMKAPINQTTEVELHYSLPENIGQGGYKLLIQKQSGSGTVPTEIHIKDKNGNWHNFNFDLSQDYLLDPGF